MQPTITRIRRLDTIDGAGFVEIRSALRTLHQIQPEADPELVQLIPEISGSVAMFGQANAAVQFGLRGGSSTLLTPSETRYLMANTDPALVPRRLHARHVEWIEKAAMEFAKKMQFRLEDYVIAVLSDEPLVVVIFDDPDRPKEVVGSWNHPAFEVTLDPKTSQVVKSHFVR